MKTKKLVISVGLAFLLLFTIQLASANQALYNNEYFSFFYSGDTDHEQIHERYQLHNRLGDCNCSCECDSECDCECDCEQLMNQIRDMIRDRLKDKLQDGNCSA